MSSTDELHIASDRLIDDDLSSLTDQELRRRVLETILARIRLDYVYLTSLEMWDAQDLVR